MTFWILFAIAVTVFIGFMVYSYMGREILTVTKIEKFNGPRTWRAEATVTARGLSDRIEIWWYGNNGWLRDSDGGRALYDGYAFKPLGWAVAAEEKRIELERLRAAYQEEHVKF